MRDQIPHMLQAASACVALPLKGVAGSPELPLSQVRGALASILGRGYTMHAHRHLHHSGGADQVWHKDSYWGARTPRCGMQTPLIPTPLCMLFRYTHTPRCSVSPRAVLVPRL